MSQEIDNNVLDLIKQKGFYPYEYMSDFEKLKGELPCKEKFNSSLTDKKIAAKNMIMFLIFGKKLERKQWKIIRTFFIIKTYFKCDVLLSADVFEKIKNAIIIWAHYV